MQKLALRLLLKIVPLSVFIGLLGRATPSFLREHFGLSVDPLLVTVFSGITIGVVSGIMAGKAVKRLKQGKG